MIDPQASRLRSTFGEDADLYDRRRPGYPSEVFDDLATVAALQPGARVLEIGCGTGQATIPLAARGYDVTAVELSASLAAVAERRAQGVGRVSIGVAPFESWPLPAEPFDLVLAATSFHWIDPEVRVQKSADALRPGGSLAIISTSHIAGGTEAFFVDVQRCYERFDPATPPGLTLPTAAEIPQDSSESDASGRFGRTEFRRHEWEQTYTTEEYIELLHTYSGHRALPADAQEGLFSCIARLIDDRFGGRVTKRYLTQLALAQRRTASR